MKRKIVALISLLLTVMSQAGCAGAVGTQAPAATAVQAIVNVPAQALTETPAVAQALAQVITETPGITETPQEVPAAALFPLQKPSLGFTDSANPAGVAVPAPDQTLPLTAIVTPGHVVAFVFPDGSTVKAAGLVAPRPAEGNLTMIGMVQVSNGAALIPPVTYIVEIDLTSRETDVAGRLVSNQTTQDLKFHRTQLVRNPDRVEDASFPPISPIISSDGVCFVVSIGKPYTMDVSGAVNRYCSGGSVDKNEPILSVKANFPDQYDALVTDLNQAVAFLKNQPLPGTDAAVAVDVLPELTISEIEGHSNVNRCNGDATQCTPDIIGAPSATFWNDYDVAQKEAAGLGKNFVVTEGFVRIAQPLDIPGQQTVQPGVYWIRDWFDPQGKFIGSALLGRTEQNEPVYGLTIASTPTYFLDGPGQRQVVSWISGWHCFHWCKWQPWCP